MNKKGIKFILFCIGMATAMAASALFLIILFLNLNKVRVITFENDPIVAGIEIIFLTIGIATCAAASEIYYKYLQSA